MQSTPPRIYRTPCVPTADVTSAICEADCGVADRAPASCCYLCEALFLEKLLVAQVVNKFLISCGTRTFITVLTTAGWLVLLLRIR
jgi:hypothetical protein